MKHSVEVSRRVVGRNVNLAKYGKIEKYETFAFSDEYVHFHITERAFQYLEQLTVSTLAPHAVKREDQEFKQFQALARSKAWRASNNIRLGGIPLFYEDSEYNDLLDAIEEQKATRYFELNSIQNMLAMSSNISLEEKVVQTLVSFHEHIKQVIELKHFPYLAFDEKSQAFFRKPSTGDVFEFGMTWATVDEECHFIYDSLVRKGYISWTQRKGPVITGKGYEVLEQHRRNEINSSAGIFVIQRYDEERNPVLRQLFNEIESELKIEIRAVWDDEHIDKIDERILHKILSAKAVILDVANDRFNVGFEAGYALANKKPIIAIMEKEEEGGGIKPPFDIATLNCFGYSFNELDKLKKVLIARIQVAIQI